MLGMSSAVRKLVFLNDSSWQCTEMQNALKAALAQVLCETSCPNLCHSELHLSSVPLISLEQVLRECPAFFNVTVLHLEVTFAVSDEVKL